MTTTLRKLLVETQNTHAQSVSEHHGFRVTATYYFPSRFHTHAISGRHKMAVDVVAR